MTFVTRFDDWRKALSRHPDDLPVTEDTVLGQLIYDAISTMIEEQPEKLVRLVQTDDSGQALDLFLNDWLDEWAVRA